MAKALKTAALVVGAAALIATGIGAAAGAAVIGTAAAAGAAAGTATFLGISAATFTAIGAIAGAASGLLSLAAAAAAPKGSVGGNATKFKIDKDAGLPYMMGRTYSGGNVVHRQYYGSKNSLESWVTVHSLGPVKSLGPLLIDKVAAVLMAGTAIGGAYSGFMWLDTQLGACPESRALAGPQGAIPGWSSSSKLSGLAADLWTLKFDTKGKVYPNGVPQRGRVGEGVYVYDGRLDSTVPGGSGPCRLGQEDTYVYNENPACHALTWAYGRIQNGVLVAGGGLKVTGIDVTPFLEWASVCDANDWKVGGIVYTTSDNSWDILKMIAQAGGGEVMPVGALLSCMFSAPRVSIGTITSDDISGDLDVPSTASRRTRRNTIIPRVRLESHGWEIVPLDPIPIADYIAVDGASRPKEIEFPLVQQVDQGAQLGLYDLLNARELDGIVLPCKVYAIGYRPGDCLTVDVPEANLVDRDVIVRNREIDGSSMGIALTCRSETQGKHPFALGKGGKAPPTPDLSVPGTDLSAPDAASWTAVGTTLSANGASIPALVVTGAVDNANTDAVLVEYRPMIGDAPWSSAGLFGATTTRVEVTGVTTGTDYQVAISYRIRGTIGDRLVLGPAKAGAFATSAETAGLIQNSAPIQQGFITSADTGGATASITIAAHTRRYADKDVQIAGGVITGLLNSTYYDIGYDDLSRNGGTVSFIATTTPPDARLSAAHPARHYVGYVTTAAAGGASTGGGGATPPGGGYCVTTLSLVMMADGSWKRAGDIRRGDRVRTRHETTLEWGEFTVTAAAIVNEQIMRAHGYPDATAEHRFWTRQHGWFRMADIGVPAGSAEVVRLTVPGAATYVARHPSSARGVLSHNLKQQEANQA